MSTNIVNILNELAASLGRDAVLEACQTFVSPGGSIEIKKVKKEHKPRGPSVWNVEVQKVLEEMRAAAGPDAKVTHKMAMEEASRRRRENDPEAQAKYEAGREKRQAAKGSADADAGAETVDAPKATKGRGRPKAEKKD